MGCYTSSPPAFVQREGLPDPLQEHLVTERLFEEVNDLGPFGAGGLSGVARATHQDHRQADASHTHLVEKCQATHAWHEDVEQQAAGTLWIVARQKLFPPATPQMLDRSAPQP